MKEGYNEFIGPEDLTEYNWRQATFKTYLNSPYFPSSFNAIKSEAKKLAELLPKLQLTETNLIPLDSNGVSSQEQMVTESTTVNNKIMTEGKKEIVVTSEDQPIRVNNYSEVDSLSPDALRPNLAELQAQLTDKITEFQSKLMNVALKKAYGDGCFAEDVLQESYLRIWKQVQRGKLVDELQFSYFCQVIGSVAIDEFRKRHSRINAVSLEVQTRDIPDKITRGVDLEVADIDSNSRIKEIADSVIGNDPIRREIFDGYIVGDTGISEMQRNLGLTIGVVRGQVTKFKKQLVTELSEKELTPALLLNTS